MSAESLAISPALQELCHRHGALALKLTKETLIIAVSEANIPQRDAQLRFASGRKVELRIWSSAQLEAALHPLEPTVSAPTSQSQEPSGHYHSTISQSVASQRTTTVQSAANPTNANDDEAVVNFINHVLQVAIQRRASDIHFEPQLDQLNIRLRIDGVLQPLAARPELPAMQIVARLKIISQLDIAERRLPQDGQLKLSINQQHHPMRIATLPTQYGEKVVLRLQENDNRTLSLEQLGLNLLQLEQYRQALHSPQGFILVTGPTGSGKTLTLYSGLKQLDHQQRNICSVEDPIELSLSGINQTAVNPKIGLTFHLILRALLRQDPDVIMIGEIRDRETAEIAVNAAQTGHLVLSTLHSNSACEALIRLEQMGLPPYLLASSLKLVIAQRLVRQLCPHCKHPVAAEHIVKPQLWPGGLHAWQAVGCEHCFGGYYGRSGLYETLWVNNEIQQCLLDGANLSQLESLARQQGLLPLLYAGLDQVNRGITSLEELHRVLGNEQ